MTPLIALTRARDQSERSAARLAARGFAVVIAPVTWVRPVEVQPTSESFDAAIATSAKAIAQGGARLRAFVAGAPLHVVGERAHAAAAAQGFRLASPPARDVAGLLQALAAALPANARVLYLAGRDRRPELESALSAAGHRVSAVETYAAEPRERWDDEEARAVAGADAYLHYSRRSAELTVALAGRAGLLDRFKSRPQVCLSREAAAPLALAAPRVFWPHEPNEDSLFDTLESALADWIPR